MQYRWLFLASHLLYIVSFLNSELQITEILHPEKPFGDPHNMGQWSRDNHNVTVPD